jgi:hypothetical protein
MKFKLGRRLVRVVFITVVLFIVLVYVPGIITNDKELLGSTDFYKNSVTEKKHER